MRVENCGAWRVREYVRNVPCPAMHAIVIHSRRWRGDSCCVENLFFHLEALQWVQYYPILFNQTLWIAIRCGRVEVMKMLEYDRESTIHIEHWDPMQLIGTLRTLTL